MKSQVFRLIHSIANLLLLSSCFGVSIRVKNGGEILLKGLKSDTSTENPFRSVYLRTGGNLRQSARVKSTTIITSTRTNQVPDISCTLPSYFADPQNCTKYFYCLPTPSGFQILSLDCVVGVFDQVESKCIQGSIPSHCQNLTTIPDIYPTLTPDTASDTNDSHVTVVNIDHPVDVIPLTDDTIETQPTGVADDVEEFDPNYGPRTFNPHELSNVRVVTTQHSSPNAWFGLVKTNGNKLDNPFKDEDTSLALILDFSTSKLQIYSRNIPRK